MLGYPPIENLRRMFAYDPDTGLVTRRVAAGRLKAGSIVGIIAPNKRAKRFRVRISGRFVSLLPIIWALQTGEYPPKGMSVDHKEQATGEWADNRWGNLRLATQQQQTRNRRVRVDSTTGLIGVMEKRKKVGGKTYRYYLARVYNAIGKRVERLFPFTALGMFQAALWRDEIARKSHGKFAVCNYKWELT